MAETVVVVSHIEEFNSVLAKYFFENKSFQDDFRSLCDELEKLEDFLCPTVQINCTLQLILGLSVTSLRNLRIFCTLSSNVCNAIFHAHRMGSDVCNAIFHAHRMGRKIKMLNERITKIQIRWLCPPCRCSSVNSPDEPNSKERCECSSVNEPVEDSKERWDGKDAHQLKRVYETLPDVLKLCVVYFSVFPTNIEIECEYLLHLWISQGFVSGHVYNLARLYIDELIDRRLIIQVSEDGGVGRVECCKFHNLLHDLVVSESVKQTACLLKPGEQLKTLPVNDCQQDLRSISLIKNNISAIEEAIDCPELRTLLLAENLQLKSISASFFDNIAHLTVLDLSQTDISSLPKSIGKLKHLKFLNVSKTKILELPEDLSGLWRLQFLDVSHCPHLSNLHSGIGKHKCMLYLNVEGCGMLEQLPPGVSQLCLLHTLKGTVSSARPDAETKTNATISDSRANATAEAKALQSTDIKGLLEGLTLLRHLSLQINYLSARSSEEGIFIQPKEGTFGGMKKLQTLCIMNRGDYPFHLAKDTEVMECLETVRLSKCVVPKWIFGLQNLVDLELELDHSDNYEGLEKAPNLKRLQLLCNYKCIEFPKQFGECMAFPKLEEFIIERFNSLEKFPVLNPTAMPMLKYFRLRWCDKLKNMIEGIENLRSLEEVEFLVDPQKAQDLWKGQWLQILKARQIKIIATPRDQSVIDAIVTRDIAILD